MTTSAQPVTSKTMFNYFTKLPSKACIVEEANPRKLAPAFNKQHVEEFIKNKLEQFDAELFCPTNIDREPKLSGVTNYLNDIKTAKHKPYKLNRKPRGPLRAKLLQYHEDVRPPYYGTWQRKSKQVTGRHPFRLDNDVFDYEIDSEAEWDIGGPGESLKGDDSEDDEELDDYEIDMKTFVPHGYVSDDEVEVHSDQEDPNNKSANQSMDETKNCDVEDDSNSVRIVCEYGNISKNDQGQKEQPQKQQQNRQQNANSPAQQGPPPLKLTNSKTEIKPISLGLYFEAEPTILSESKIQFLRAFQGVSCN